MDSGQSVIVDPDLIFGQWSLRAVAENRWSWPTKPVFCITTAACCLLMSNVSDPVTGPVWLRGLVEVQLYSSMAATLEGGEWSAARPGRTLPLGKIRYPFYRRLGGPHVRSGRAENLIPTGIRSRTVQPVVSHYTDWTTRPTHLW